jgi:hypothetical protein
MHSPCESHRDGSLEDHYRWAHDGGGFGFYLTTDHIDCLNEYMWDQSLTYADLFNREEDLATLYGFEATYLKWGQANHYFVDRSISDVVARAGLSETLDAGLGLYDERDLADRVLVARHYHGDTGKGSVPDWHPEYEQLFEVVQTRGFCFGVMEGILAEGARMGVNGGCDHSNPPGGVMPWKYSTAITGLWVKSITRQDVFSALKQRRTCATNGKKILLFLAADGHAMGEEYETSAPPTIRIEAEATTEIERLELIRDGEPVLVQTDCGRKSDVTFTDEKLKAGDHYYYVKLTQKEELYDNYKGIAVSSPVWITRT